MKLRRLALRFAVAPAFLLLTLQPAFSMPQNVLVARDRTEPVVAVDPRHPSTIVVGSNTSYSTPVGGSYPTGYFTSHDGGLSFSSGNIPIVRPYTTAADPSVTIADNGTVFFLNLGETVSYCSGGHSAVILTHSTDGGRTFRAPVILDTNSADDKPNLALRNLVGRPVQVFATWNRDNANNTTDIWYARSADGGQSFSRPTRLFGSRVNNFGSVPVVGPHRRVYVFWSHFPDRDGASTSPTRIYLRESTDDGVHFGPVRSVAGPFPSVPAMVDPGALRNFTQPAALAAPDGTLYLAWAAVTRRHGHGVVDADIKLSRSRDGGLTWSRPQRVNDVARSDRFMPAMSLLPDGSLGIAYYDRRNSPWHLDTYAARVSFVGGFHASSNVRVNRRAAPIADLFYIKPGSTCFAAGRFFGDYIGAAAVNGELCVTWADTGLHVYPESDVWFARVKLPQVR